MSADPWEIETTTSGGPAGDWELCPAGNYPGTIVGLFDVGLHEKEGDSGTYEARQLVLAIQSTKRTSKGTHFYFSKMYTYSMRDNSNFYKLVSSLIGRKFTEGEKFNPKSLVGMPVFCNITQSEVEKNGKKKTYHNLENITAWPEDFPLPDKVSFRAPVIWSVRDGTPRPDCSWVPAVYGKDISKLVSLSKEFRQGATGATTEAPTPAQQAETRRIAQAAGIAATDDENPAF